MKGATTVNKKTGHVNGYIDRRTKADRERHIKHANESPLYTGPDSNNRKVFGKDLSHPNYDDQKTKQSKNDNNQQTQNSGNNSQQETTNNTNQNKEDISENEAARKQNQDNSTQAQQNQTNNASQNTDNNQNNGQQNSIEKPQSVSRD